MKIKSLPPQPIILIMKVHQTLALLLVLAFAGASASREVKLNELSYDPDRIYKMKLQNEISWKYTVRGPYIPQRGFKYPQRSIGNIQLRL
jgi:hypothetical protein